MSHQLFGGDEVRVWVEPGGPIMLRAVEPSGDPVELNEDQAIELADLLRRLADQISN
jgi:hypothetical protein